MPDPQEDGLRTRFTEILSPAIDPRAPYAVQMINMLVSEALRLAASGGWRPIAEAPRDGTSVLLWAEVWEMSWGIQIGAFRDGQWECGEGTVGEDEVDTFTFGLTNDDEPINIGPTHFKLLEPPPAGERGG